MDPCHRCPGRLDDALTTGWPRAPCHRSGPTSTAALHLVRRSDIVVAVPEGGMPAGDRRLDYLACDELRLNRGRQVL